MYIDFSSPSLPYFKGRGGPQSKVDPEWPRGGAVQTRMLLRVWQGGRVRCCHSNMAATTDGRRRTISPSNVKSCVERAGMVARNKYCAYERCNEDSKLRICCRVGPHNVFTYTFLYLAALHTLPMHNARPGSSAFNCIAAVKHMWGIYCLCECTRPSTTHKT